MIYKNKNISFYYSVIFVVFVVGAVMMGLALMLIVGGLISAGKIYKNVQPVDAALQASGNHAGKAVYFDIIEPPVFLGKEKKEYYFLLTNGNEYRVAELDEEEYEEISAAAEAAGSYHIQGLTHYIVGSDIRNEVASKAKKLTGQNMTEDTMDSILGDVCIECMPISFGNVFKNGLGLAGIILGIVNTPIFCCGFFELRASRKVISLSGITAKDIDNEANKDGSVWLDLLRIYITENMVLGIISDGKEYWSQVAFRYNEIQRIYGYNKIIREEASYVKTNYIIETVAADGNKYTLSDNRLKNYSEMYNEIAETEELFAKIKDKNPNVICEPENVKYRTYKFSYKLIDYEGNDVLNETIDDSDKQDIIMNFDYSNPAKYFKPADAIVSMKMSFPEEGIVEITAGYFGDREKDVEPALYDFLKGQLMDGWGEGYEYNNFVVDYRELES